MFDTREENALRLVFQKYNEKLSAVLPAKQELEKITITEAFEKRADRLIRRQNKFYYVFINTLAKRVACFVILLILLLTTVTFSVKGLRDPFLEFVAETIEKVSNLIAPDDSSNVGESGAITPLIPEYIPDGFYLDSETNSGKQIHQIYQNDSHHMLLFSQYFVKDKAFKSSTKGVKYDEVMINNTYTAKIYHHKDMVCLSFATDEYAFTIMISDEYSENELIKIAESINK